MPKFNHADFVGRVSIKDPTTNVHLSFNHFVQRIGEIDVTDHTSREFRDRVILAYVDFSGTHTDTQEQFEALFSRVKHSDPKAGAVYDIVTGYEREKKNFRSGLRDPSHRVYW